MLGHLNVNFDVILMKSAWNPKFLQESRTSKYTLQAALQFDFHDSHMLQNAWMIKP